MELANSVIQFVQLILIAVIGLAVPVLAYQGYKFAKAKVAEAKSQLNVNQLYLFNQFVAIAVKAMEQAKLKEQLEASAEELLAGAVFIVQNFLDNHGMSGFNVADIEAAIRAALRDGIHKAEDEDKAVG